MNKLASARASGVGGGNKVLTDLVEGLEEPAVSIELRLKIDQSHPDLKGGYAIVCCDYWLKMPSLTVNKLIEWFFQVLPGIWRGCTKALGEHYRFRPEASESPS